MRTLVLSLAAILAVFPCAAGAAEYVVDQKNAAASDDGAGTADKPFKTISKGLAAAKAGDTVLVRGGVYREMVEFQASGTADARITLKAAPGERVLVSGSDAITGWKKCTKEELHGNPNWERVYQITVGWRPNALFVNGRLQTPARWPAVDKTMYRVQEGNSLVVVDAEHLAQPAGWWDGATLVVRGPSGNRDAAGRIVKYDADKHSLTVDKKRAFEFKGGHGERGDENLYFVENAVAAIDAPGRYVLDESVTPHKLYLWPSESNEIEKLDVEGTRRAKGEIMVTWPAGGCYLTIDGLEVAYGEGGGIGAKGEVGNHIEVLNCFIHDNRGSGPYAGIRLLKQSDCLLKRCRVWRNVHQGIGIGYYCKNVTVEECEVFDSSTDGMVVGHYCKDTKFVRCVSRRHWYEGHPDAFQCFVGVDGLTLDSCLFLDCGQMWQCSATYNVKCVNNIWAGSHANGLSLSNRPDKENPPNHTWEFRNNTIAFVPTGAININKDYRLFNNVVYSGHPGGGLFGGIEYGWVSDHNLLWDHGGDGRRISWAGKNLGGFADYQKTTGQDGNGKLADPKFRCAPKYYTAGDNRKAPWYDLAGNSNTASKLFLERIAKGDFEVGDCVEVNWDGVPRTVKEAGSGFIVIDPPLAETPRSADFCVGNWKKEKGLALDLRLADDSPGKKMGDDGKDVGSSIDIQAYLRGDLEGTGKSVLPEVPKDVPQ